MEGLWEVKNQPRHRFVISRMSHRLLPENQNKKVPSLIWDKTSILRYHPS